MPLVPQLRKRESLDSDSFFREFSLEQADRCQFRNPLRIELNAILPFDGQDRLEMTERVPRVDRAYAEVGGYLVGRNVEDIRKQIT